MKTVTRRDFCQFCVLSTLGVLLGCRSTRSDDSDVSSVWDTFNRIADREPQLPGVRSLLSINEENLSQGLTTDDLAILTGALYLEAERQLRKLPPARQRQAINDASIKSALSQPIDTTPYGRDYIHSMLRETRATLATDPRFRGQLAEAQEKANRKKCLDGTPRWICGVIIVIIIIIIIVILVENRPTQGLPADA